MQIKHQDDNLCDAKLIHTGAAKYFIPSNAIRACFPLAFDACILV